MTSGVAMAHKMAILKVMNIFVSTPEKNIVLRNQI